MEKHMSLSVNQLARLAGVSRRTLHYYDEIGLLHPSAVEENGYRQYGEEALLHLQQILFYRELGFNLEQIKSITTRKDFNLLEALAEHRTALLQRAGQIQTLIATIDKTMMHLRGEVEMADKDYYSGFDEAKQKEYAREVEQRWGEQAVQSQKRWEASTRQEKNAFLAEMHEISAGLLETMDQGAHSPDVQTWVRRWHEFIDQKCYPCSLEIFENLGHMYVEDPRFTKTYEDMRPGMAAFMDEAMTFYCRQRGEK